MKPKINTETPKFERGDIIVNKGSGNSYVVIDIVDGHVIAARTLTVSNPSEWEQYPIDFNKLSSEIHANANDRSTNQRSNGHGTGDAGTGAR